MIIELEALDRKRLQELDHIMIQKKKVAQAYNKQVGRKSFEEGELVWKVVLPISAKDRELGKWSPNWEGPFKVHQVLIGNVYWLSSLERSHTKGSSMGSTSRSTFPQCWKSLILPRKTKVGNEEITSKIGLIDHLELGKLFLVITLSNKV